MSQPLLDMNVINDDSKLAAAISEVLKADPKYALLTRAILRAQKSLQDVATERQFLLYLDIEAAGSTRLDHALRRIAKWAFLQGRRSS